MIIVVKACVVGDSAENQQSTEKGHQKKTDKQKTQKQEAEKQKRKKQKNNKNALR